jgi:pyrroline-5-carboxylate reductase
MKDAVIGFIGAGNMGHSLIGGLINDGYDPKKIWAADLHPEKLKALDNFSPIHTTTENQAVVEAADVIILAVKPQSIQDVTTSLASLLQKRRPLLLSIAAGITVAHLQKWAGPRLAIVRCMPNTPAMIGCGATGLFANEFVTSEQKNLAESILRAVGVVVWVNNESLIDTITALSGSGPAYFFYVMEALEEGAKSLGLSEETAHLLTLETALGSARMALESAQNCAELRHRVTSKGGTTEQGILALEQGQLKTIFKNALEAAKRRAEELAASLS